MSKKEFIMNFSDILTLDEALWLATMKLGGCKKENWMLVLLVPLVKARKKMLHLTNYWLGKNISYR